MSCDSCCGASNGPATIYQSADTPISFQLLKETCIGGPLGPFDLTEATEIWAMFPTLVSPPLILKLSLSELVISSPAGAGVFTGMISASNALLLQLGLINVEVRVTIASVVTVAEIIGQLTVTPSLFPGS
jgi:hypothetical protein